VYIVAGEHGHVVVTTESSPTRDDATRQMLGDIVASVRIGEVAAQRRRKASIVGDRSAVQRNPATGAASHGRNR
jgi:hypothetical protein